jgi:hypothetical protein
MASEYVADEILVRRRKVEARLRGGVGLNVI